MTYEELKYNKNRHEIMERAQLFYETYKAIRKLISLKMNQVLIWNNTFRNHEFIKKNKRKMKTFSVDLYGHGDLRLIVLTLKQNL